MAQDGGERIGFGSQIFIPLTEEQFATLGKIAAVLSSAESVMDAMIMNLTGITNWYSYEIVFQGKGTQAKNKIFRQIITQHFTKESAKIPLAACKAMEDLARDRNHAIHGFWSYSINGQTDVLKADKYLPDYETAPVVAVSMRGPSRMGVEELPKLLEKAETAAQKVVEAFEYINKVRPEQKIRPLIITTSEAPPPEPPKIF